MTPRVDVIAPASQRDRGRRANLTRATGLSRFPVYRDTSTRSSASVHIKDVLAGAGRRGPRPPSPSWRGAAAARARVACPRRAAGAAARRRRTMAVVIDEYGGTAAWSPWRTSSRSSSARSATSTTPRRRRPGATASRPAAPAAGDGLPRPDELAGSAVGCPRARTRPSPALVTALARIPAEGDDLELAGWRARRPRDRDRRRAERVRPPPRRPTPTGRTEPMTDVSCASAPLLLANAFFVGAEFALISVAPQPDRAARPRRVARRAGRRCGALEHLSAMMAAAQLGITVSSLVLGAVAEPAIAHLLEPPFHAVGVPEGLIHPIAFVIALAVATYLHMLIGEMVPKNIALAAPVPPALVLGRPWSPSPALRRSSSAQRLRQRSAALLRVEPKDEVASALHQRPAGRLLASAPGRPAGAEQERLLSEALAFEARPRDSVVLPVGSVVAVRRTPPSPNRGADRRTGYSRFPVGGGAAFMGYVHVKDVLDIGTDAPRSPRCRPRPAAAGARGRSAVVDRAAGNADHRRHLGQVLDATGHPSASSCWKTPSRSLWARSATPPNAAAEGVAHPVTVRAVPVRLVDEDRRLRPVAQTELRQGSGSRGSSRSARRRTAPRRSRCSTGRARPAEHLGLSLGEVVELSAGPVARRRCGRSSASAGG